MVLDCANMVPRMKRCVIGSDPISILILILPRAREPGNALISDKTVNETLLYGCPYHTLRFRGNSQATGGTMHRYLPPVDEREEAPLAQPLRTFTGRTRSKLPVSREHRLPVALSARGYNPFTFPTLFIHLFLPFNNYINNNNSIIIIIIISTIIEQFLSFFPTLRSVNLQPILIQLIIALWPRV